MLERNAAPQLLVKMRGLLSTAPPLLHTTDDFFFPIPLQSKVHHIAEMKCLSNLAVRIKT